MVMVMATFNVTVPDELVLGRNGAIGKLAVDWSRVPQVVLDHIASVYFPQYITDSANAGGKEATQTERMAAANKKLAGMYEGKIRTRGDGDSEPADPVEAMLHKLARGAIAKKIKTSDEFKKLTPKKGFDRVLAAMQARNGTDMTWAKAIEATISANPKMRATAKKMVADADASAASVEL